MNIDRDKIYLDNAATSFPKPECVAEAVCSYIKEHGININRGSYEYAYAAEEMVYETRCLLCRLFGSKDPRQVVFTKNVTESLNIIIKGLLRPRDHVIVSPMEHNSVMRPLVQLASAGVSFDRAECEKDGSLVLSSLEKLLQEMSPLEADKERVLAEPEFI